MTVGSSNTNWYQRIHLNAFFLGMLLMLWNNKSSFHLKQPFMITEVVPLKRRTLPRPTSYVHHKMKIWHKISQLSLPTRMIRNFTCSICVPPIHPTQMPWKRICRPKIIIQINLTLDLPSMTPNRSSRKHLIWINQKHIGGPFFKVGWMTHGWEVHL